MLTDDQLIEWLAEHRSGGRDGIDLAPREPVTPPARTEELTCEWCGESFRVHSSGSQAKNAALGKNVACSIPCRGKILSANGNSLQKPSTQMDHTHRFLRNDARRLAEACIEEALDHLCWAEPAWGSVRRMSSDPLDLLGAVLDALEEKKKIKHQLTRKSTHGLGRR